MCRLKVLTSAQAQRLLRKHNAGTLQIPDDVIFLQNVLVSRRKTCFATAALMILKSAAFLFCLGRLPPNDHLRIVFSASTPPRGFIATTPGRSMRYATTTKSALHVRVYTATTASASSWTWRRTNNLN